MHLQNVQLFQIILLKFVFLYCHVAWSRCLFGKCNRLRDSEGIDIGFDLLFEGIPLKGFVECKYTDANLGEFTILVYIIKAKLKKSRHLFNSKLSQSFLEC